MSNIKDSLGDRMKNNYENRSKAYLTRRMPVLIRLDGKAFHTFTRGLKKPFDEILIQTMQETAKFLCENIQGCKIAYTQSDEITLLLTDYDELNTDAWFDYSIQKMCSVSASMATLAFNNAFSHIVNEQYNILTSKDGLYDGSVDEFDALFDNYFSKINQALFDARAFNIPKEEVCNAFIWRQQDATRNSIQMVGQHHFSHKEMHGKNTSQIQEMLWQEKDINFNDLPVYQKRGSCIIRENYEHEDTTRARWVADLNIPIFTQNREYIEKYVNNTMTIKG